MSRCQGCDYSPQTPSLYEFSLTKAKSYGKLLHKDRRTGLYWCDECRDAVSEVVIEQEISEETPYNEALDKGLDNSLK